MQIHGGEGKTKDIRLDFSVNINPLGMPQAVREAWQSLAFDASAMEAYPERSCKELRRAAANHYRVPDDWIVCGCGASELIYKIAYRYRGCRALVVSPGFGEYEKALREAGCEVYEVKLQREGGFTFDEGFLKRFCLAVEDVEAYAGKEHIREERAGKENGGEKCLAEKQDGEGHDGEKPAEKRTALVFLCSPNNPVGGRIPEAMLKNMLEFCMHRGVRVVVDECFLPFVTGGEPTIDYLRAYAEGNESIERFPEYENRGHPERFPEDENREHPERFPEYENRGHPERFPEDENRGHPERFPKDENREHPERFSEYENRGHLERFLEYENKKCPERFVKDEKEDHTENMGVSPIILKALTKSHAIPGVRLGLAISSDTKFIRELQEAGPPWTVSGAAAKLGMAAFTGWDEAEFDCMRKTVAEERSYLVRGLTGAGAEVYAGEGNFILFSVTEGKTLFEFMRSHGILIRSCISFGLGQDFYRIAVRKREENVRFLEAFSDWAGRSI